MSISFRCAACQKHLKASQGLTGKRVKCSGCGNVMVVPASAPAPAVAAPPPLPACPVAPAPFPVPPAAPATPGGKRRWLLLWVGVGLGTVLILAMLAVGALGIYLLGPRAVWVGDIKEEQQSTNEGFQAKMSMHSEGGKLWITVYDLDQNSVAGWVEDDSRSKEIESELDAAAKDVPTAAMKVKAGWLPKGCRAVKVLSSYGMGVEAANFAFSPTAVKVVVDEATIAKQRFERP